MKEGPQKGVSCMPDALAQGIDTLQDDDARLGDLLVPEALPFALLEGVHRHLQHSTAIKRAATSHNKDVPSAIKTLRAPSAAQYIRHTWLCTTAGTGVHCSCISSGGAGTGAARSSDLSGLALLEIPEVLQEQVVVCQPWICTAARGWGRPTQTDPPDDPHRERGTPQLGGVSLSQGSPAMLYKGFSDSDAHRQSWSR